jgi:hypothetical protein
MSGEKSSMERWKAWYPRHEEEFDTDTVSFAKDDLHCTCEATATGTREAQEAYDV